MIPGRLSREGVERRSVSKAALKSSEGQARIEQNKAAISDAAKEIDALLTDVASPSVRASVVRAFARSRPCSSPARPRTSRGGAASMRSEKCDASGDYGRRLPDISWPSAYTYAGAATTRVSKSRPRQTSSAFRRQVKTSLPPGAIPAVGSSATCRPRPVSLVATSAWVFQSSRV
jgi:hypothetical protein